MIKPSPHSAGAKTSLKVLWRQVLYIADPDDSNHVDKLVLPSRNHNCGGQEARHFLFAVMRKRSVYNHRRCGKRGKRTKRKWEEYIYSSENGMVPIADGTGMEPCLNDDERQLVEKRLLAGPIGRGSARLGWHIDKKTGRCDCHILVSVHDDYGVVWMNDGFGKGKMNLGLELERIEERLVEKLNAERPPPLWLKTTRQRHREKRKMAGNPTFAEKLVIAGWDGKMDSLQTAAEKAKYQVIKQTKGTIEVKLVEEGKRQKESRYHLETLLKSFWKAKKRQQNMDDRENPETPPL